MNAFHRISTTTFAAISKSFSRQNCRNSPSLFFRLPSLFAPVDMDIPLPDELEWLEANSQLDEDQPDPAAPYPYPFPPEEEPQSPTSSSDSPINGHKRTRSNDPDSSIEDVAVRSVEKRTKTYGARKESDEDWLWFSPPREQRTGADEEESVEVVVVEKKEEERILSRYVSEIDGDFIPVTAPSGGDRVYAKICRVEKEERPKKLNVNVQSNGLILETVNVLLQRVEQEAFAKALHASTADQTDAIPYETQVVHEKLWVDKYAPNSFTELLSDEQTNREVLLWLKQWDSSVFGSEIRSTSDDVLSALRHHSSVAQYQRHSDSNFLRKNGGQRWNNGNLRHSIKLDHEKNNSKGFHDLRNTKPRLSGLPEHKILLLCGPPGLGKTTLAHVAAKHCGYRVVEVNASDDRSSASIESKILDVVQMNSVIVDSKPKCLVIDEIDGALGDGKGAVEVILKMVSAERNSDIGKENVIKGAQSGMMSSKKGHKMTPLLRPVICICNDLYAPALRPLRQVAKVHIFVQPTVSRVVSRLKHICNNEGMNTSSIALALLAEYTECDIRSCLNTLQFLNKKKETLNVLDIGSQVVGRKDMSRTVFDIWKEIFQKRKVKRERKSGSSCGSMSNGTHFLHTLISNRGDYDVILDGVHENILQLHYHDPIMQKTVKCFNSLGVSDLLRRYTLRTQQMTLNAYQPPLAIIVHSLVAQVQKPNIEWPKSYQRYRTMLMDKMDMLRSWQSKIAPGISRHLSTKSFVEDSISLLLHILSPPTLRPVALHLLSEKEKNELAQLVSSMVSYSITYKNTKISPLSFDQQHEAALDASILSFDPPIFDLINFKGYNSGHYVLPLAMKQVLVHEVEKQKILQVSRSVHDECTRQNLEAEGQKSGAQSAKTHCATNYSNIQSGKKMSSPSKCVPSGSTKSSKLDSGKSSMSSAIGRCSGNQKKASNASANFFDRFRKVISKGSLDTGTNDQKITLERDSHPLLFKFNEGFTNAVKRPIRMREFLL